MELIKKIKLFFWLAVICFTVSSMSFLFLPHAFENSLNRERNEYFIIGTVFWLFLVLGVLLLFHANTFRREFAKTRLGGDYRMKSRIGILMFFVNIPGTVSDVIFIISLIAFIVILTVDVRSKIIYVIFALLILSFEMHCIFNGRIYKSTKFRRVKGR